MTFLAPREAGALLGLSVRTLSGYRSMGGGPAYYKFGRSIRYTLEDLRQWAESRRYVRGPDRTGSAPDEEAPAPRPGPR